MHIDDLSNDVLLEIVDNFELEKIDDLFDLAESSSKFRVACRHHAITIFRIHEKKLEFSYTRHTSPTRFNDDSIVTNDNIFFIRLLQNFGDLIPHVEIDHRACSNVNSIKGLSALINKYCSDSLKELTLYCSGDNWNGLWRKPFKQLKRLHFKYFPSNCESNMENLSETFPSLQHFKFQPLSIDSSILKCFEHRFPHLKYVELPAYYNKDPISGIQCYEKFMEMNPQIRNLSIMIVDSLDLLRLMSAKLSNLETLKIVTTVKIYPTDLIADNSIKFDRLRELEIRFPKEYFGYDFRSNHNWTNFIIRNHELRILNTNSLVMDLNEWKMIVDNLPYLVEIKSIFSSNHFEKNKQENGLMSLMSRETNLKKVTFQYEYTKKLPTILRDLINSKWRLEEEFQDHMKEITCVRND